MSRVNEKAHDVAHEIRDKRQELGLRVSVTLRINGLLVKFQL